jgi:hypothetical protein
LKAVPPVGNLNWTRHFVYRREQLRTTWKFRGLVVFVLVAAAWLTNGWWTTSIARSLVCESNAVPSDAILIENFDADYLSFEQATTLRRTGFAARVMVPIKFDAETAQPNLVSMGTANLLANIAHLGDFEIVPMHEVEPISLNAARDIQRFVQQEHIRSVIVVAPYFRSRRSAHVYDATLGRAGVSISCQPVRRTDQGLATWTQSLHGVQDVAEQWAKLQYYRLYVLPFHVGGKARDAANLRMTNYLVQR